MTTFTLATAEQLLQDSQVNEFAVDFDAAWEWLGYTRRDVALDSLKDFGFETGVDFSVLTRKTPTGGRPRVFYYLTIDCFKQWAMVSGTSKGKEVRR